MSTPSETILLQRGFAVMEQRQHHMDEEIKEIKSEISEIRKENSAQMTAIATLSGKMDGVSNELQHFRNHEKIETEGVTLSKKDIVTLLMAFAAVIIVIVCAFAGIEIDIVRLFLWQ